MNTAALAQFLEPVVATTGLEIDRIEVLPAGRRSLVRVFLDGDGPQGRGPSLDEIAEATRVISAALDETDLTGTAPYTLEVSSRGVGRPLTEAKHFRRNRGRLVELTGLEETVLGRIVSVTEDAVVLQVDDQEREVALDSFEQAVVQVELRALAEEE